MSEQDTPAYWAFRNVARTGVIYVMSKAYAHGHRPGAQGWANLGQGAPETGQLPGGPPRLESIPLSEETMEYSHVVGMAQLREAVAELYNKRYRQGMASQYTAENVAIAPGGRPALVRLACAMGDVNIGHLIPDYTAYAELLNEFRNLIPIPLPLHSKHNYRLRPQDLERAVTGMGLGAVLISNPSNPTGQVVHGEELRQCIEIMRNLRCTWIADEFYSHYHYGISDQPAISSAAYVEDVDKDPVIIVDGLSKNWRYPGLRLSWTLGPRDAIRAVASAGSFLDGGASHATQVATIPLITPERADQEARSVQKVFGEKRRYVLERLRAMGIGVSADPEGSFYIFASLSSLPASLRDGFDFFNAALKHKVICVPGVFFDVDPGRRRSHIPSRLRETVRISYGACMEDLVRGLDSIEAMISES